MDMRDQYENRVGRMDAYGNPIQPQQTDAYGNPIHQTAHGVPHQATYGHEVREGIGGKDTAVGHGTGAGHMAGTGGQAQMMHPEGKHRAGGVLRRSGSNSSSSSSEDDGMGGRRKKGLKEKIKEKLPGGHKTDEYGQRQHGYGQETMGATTGYGGTTAAGTPGLHHESEKKGMMEKIKEKLPGGQKTNEYGHEQHRYEQATTGYGGTTTAGIPGVYHEPEKKGMMEKIKEKLPGGQKTDEYGQQQHGYGQATTGYGGTTTTAGTPGVHHELEKKGMMEKIKEKLPCGQNPDEYGQQQHGYGQATTGYGGNTTTAGTPGVHHEPEKKGMMEKIKEKLPGGQKTDEYGQQQHGYGQATTGATTGYGGTTTAGTPGVHHEPEKKGMMEKIKEKLPGHH